MPKSLARRSSKMEAGTLRMCKERLSKSKFNQLQRSIPARDDVVVGSWIEVLWPEDEDSIVSERYLLVDAISTVDLNRMNGIPYQVKQLHARFQVYGEQMEKNVTKIILLDSIRAFFPQHNYFITWRKLETKKRVTSSPAPSTPIAVVGTTTTTTTGTHAMIDVPKPNVEVAVTPTTRMAGLSLNDPSVVNTTFESNPTSTAQNTLEALGLDDDEEEEEEEEEEEAPKAKPLQVIDLVGEDDEDDDVPINPMLIIKELYQISGMRTPLPVFRVKFIDCLRRYTCAPPGAPIRQEPLHKRLEELVAECVRTDEEHERVVNESFKRMRTLNVA